MTWEEFSSLLVGLGENTPLVRTAMIRLEDNPKILECFNSSQHRVRNEWQSRHITKYYPEELGDFLREIQSVFASQ